MSWLVPALDDLEKKLPTVRIGGLMTLDTNDTDAAPARAPEGHLRPRAAPGEAPS
jgi:hypothetical protein